MNAPQNEMQGKNVHRILVVDDEEIVLVALRETLRREGYEVVTALNAVEGLDLLKKGAFSVILTDHQMPILTGLEFLAQVKEIQPDATRILITAVLSLSTVIDAINKGEIYRFIVKPWLREELLATVKNAVQRYELICRNAMLQASTRVMNDELSRVNRSLEQQVALVAQKNSELEKLNQALEHNLQQSIQLWVRTMETFYPILGSQARRVYELCKAMVQSLDLDPEEQKILEMSSWLYDIGLVGIPRQLIKRWLENAGDLSEAERTLVEHHPILAQELASFVSPLEKVGTVIRSHHERYDGLGYPDGLRGDDIPWLSRLLAVAVHFAECPFDGTAAVEAIRLGSGREFDPDAVRVFLRSLPSAAVPRKEREVLLSELKPGMVLAKGIYTANGILLIPEGQKLSETFIDKLYNHNRINPISQALLVYC